MINICINNKKKKNHVIESKKGENKHIIRKKAFSIYKDVYTYMRWLTETGSVYY